MTVLQGSQVTLRSAIRDDVAALVEIRSTPEVHDRWGGDELEHELLEDVSDANLHVLVIEHGGLIVGAIQWSAEADPQYRHASVDIFVDPRVHRRGIGSDAVRILARHLFDAQGHHRLVIDPAADNIAAIACYAKVGFRPVGVMRRYERGADGSWHDGLLMELLSDEFER